MVKDRAKFARRRKARKAPKLTEYESAKKRKPFTIFLIEDNQGLRSNLVNELEAQKYDVVDYMTAMEFYRDYREPRPGVLVMDMRLPGMSAVELQEKLFSEDFDLPIVMVAGHADVPMAVNAMKAGAFDFLCKPVDVTELIQAAGRAYHYFYDIPYDMDEELDETEFSLSRLTDRERQVLDFVVDGLSSREISEQLSVSTKTVEAHRARINDKMRADSVAHLIRMCFNYNAAMEGSV